MAFKNETIWIIGASSGIGKALAEVLAEQSATLILSARSEDALVKLNRELGGDHHVLPLDVADNASLQKAFQTVGNVVKRVDRIIFLAAIYEPTPIRKIDMDFARKTMEVNLLGAMAFTQHVLPFFGKQGGGQLVLCASVASYVGLPNGQPYSASKAALLSFAESLYAEEQSDDVDIKVINPGFVRTPMTDKNTFDMPMRIEPKEAAQAIAKGLKQKGFEIHFPKTFTYMMKLLASLPYWLLLKILPKMR